MFLQAGISRSKVQVESSLLAITSRVSIKKDSSCAQEDKVLLCALFKVSYQIESGTKVHAVESVLPYLMEEGSRRPMI